MINRATEEEMIEGSGHDMDCWEWWIENVVEELAGQGVTIEGSHSEIHPRNQMTMMDMFHLEAAQGFKAGRQCHCDGVAW